MTNPSTAPHHAQEFTENCGTLEYYAPELVKNLISTREGKPKHKYGASVDCWALGCIVYGRPPLRPTRRAPKRPQPPGSLNDSSRALSPACDAELLYGEPPYWSKNDREQEDLILIHELQFDAEVRRYYRTPSRYPADLIPRRFRRAPSSHLPPSRHAHVRMAQVFGQVTSPAKGFIRLLLAPDPKMRMKVEEALRHPWLQRVGDAELRRRDRAEIITRSARD